MRTEQAPVTDVVTPPTGAARVRLVLILGALIALGPLTIDMYLPALPTITTDLLTTEATVQLTLTGTLLGLAVAQLVVGPLADAFGRKRPLLVGAGVHVAASVLCAVAPNIEVLGVLRVLQGRARRQAWWSRWRSSATSTPAGPPRCCCRG